MIRPPAVVLLISSCVVFMRASIPLFEANDSTFLGDVLHELGEARPAHFMASTDSNMISHGRNIVMYGKTKGTSFVSKYFVCTSCHNTVREDADLSVVDQDGRLRYAESAGIS